MNRIPFPKSTKLKKLGGSFFEQNRQRLLKNLGANNSVANNIDSAIITFKGGSPYSLDKDGDGLSVLLPESNFFYLFGEQTIPNMEAAIELKNGEAHIFSDLSGHDPIFESFPDMASQKNHQISKYSNIKLTDFLDQKMILSGKAVHAFKLEGKNQKIVSPNLPKNEENIINIDKKILYQEICKQRSIKSEEEIKIMSSICTIAGEAHNHCMK